MGQADELTSSQSSVCVSNMHHMSSMPKSCIIAQEVFPRIPSIIIFVCPAIREKRHRKFILQAFLFFGE